MLHLKAVYPFSMMYSLYECTSMYRMYVCMCLSIYFMLL